MPRGKIDSARKGPDTACRHEESQRVGPAVEDIFRENGHEHTVSHAHETHHSKLKKDVADRCKSKGIGITLFQIVPQPGRVHFLLSLRDLYRK